MIKSVSILTHQSHLEAPVIADRITEILGRSGVNAEVLGETEHDGGLPGNPDMVIAVGGDGTVLHAQRLAVPREVPVLGVSAGRLGFLAEVLPPDLESALEHILAARYRIEQRHLIDVKLTRESGEAFRYSALNDIVLARGCMPNSLYVAAKVDGASLANYVADGIIAATATGSTAYSLAVGGPILAPELPDILLSTIAAHLSFVQSIVISPASQVELTLLRDQEASLSVDGRINTPIKYGDVMVVKSSSKHAQFVRLRDANHFYAQLVARLQHNLARARVDGSDGTNEAG